MSESRDEFVNAAATGAGFALGAAATMNRGFKGPGWVFTGFIGFWVFVWMLVGFPALAMLITPFLALRVSRRLSAWPGVVTDRVPMLRVWFGQRWGWLFPAGVVVGFIAQSQRPTGYFDSTFWWTTWLLACWLLIGVTMAAAVKIGRWGHRELGEMLAEQAG